MSAPMPTGPFAALVHVVMRRPLQSALIAIIGISATFNYVDSGPMGPGIHPGSLSVLEEVIEQMTEDDPTVASKLAAYEAAFESTHEQRERELPDEAVQFVLDHYKAGGLTVEDVRNNDELTDMIEMIYFYSLIHRFNGDVDAAVGAYLAAP